MQPDSHCSRSHLHIFFSFSCQNKCKIVIWSLLGSSHRLPNHMFNSFASFAFWAFCFKRNCQEQILFDTTLSNFTCKCWIAEGKCSQLIWFICEGEKKKNDFKEKTLSRLRRRVLSQFAEFILWSARLTNRKDLVAQLNPIQKNVRI